MDLYQLSVCLFGWFHFQCLFIIWETPVLTLMARPEGVRLLELPLWYYTTVRYTLFLVLYFHLTKRSPERIFE